MRIGLGFDIHPLASGRRLVLGGVGIEHERGLAGHSDGDVVLHALTDAILGAAGLGDIGELFPPTDPAYAGADSRQFLEEARLRAVRCGFTVESVDVIVYAEEPRIAPYKARLREAIASLLCLPPGRVNLKAKTFEGLGPIGEGRAIAAHAAVLLGEPPNA
jgi:2-C-methyl-D-erythritol 2,4-cyclodiphosphate synthase